MYGLLLEGIGEAVKRKYGESTWQAIRKKAGITHHAFITHKTYSETVIPRLTKAAHDVTNAPVDELMELFGTTFVSFVSQYGYDRVMRVLGRNLRDFLNGLDNLHEYLRFSYPKLKPPSFFCENETRKGLTLHYRSKRKGFLYYVMGQITQVAKTFYSTNVEIELMSEEETLDMTHVVMKLHFENTGFKMPKQEIDKEADTLPISSDIFFDVFPFHIVFNRAMVIKNIGSGLAAVMSHVVGQAIDEMFMLTRPMVEFTMENVLMHTNNVFELMTIDVVLNRASTLEEATDITHDEDDPDDKSRRLRLKGQMMYMTEWDAIIFLGTPIMENLERMFETGLYINDLSMHDSSRDLVLAGTQQSAELKLALDQEQQKSKKLEESMKRLDIEMKRTDQLLYQMIPKAVADRLRRGEPAMATCETFKLVTILFSDVVGFTNICSKISPLQVVGLLNGMYTKFDQLSEKHRVYKVETIGDAYMVVSGAPVMTRFHSLYICDMAFDMLEVMKELIDPHSGDHLRIRVGVHSGTVVAGVVGVKMPRYCLFGETVNCANRMEAQGTPMKIHISQPTKDELAAYPYTVEEHSTIEIKGGTVLKTYFLTGKDTTMGSALNYMKEDNADMEGNTNTSLDVTGSGGGGGGSGGGGGGSGGGGVKGANCGKQAPAYFKPPVYDHDVISELKRTDPVDDDTFSVSSRQKQKPIGIKQDIILKKQSRSKDASTPSDRLDEAEELKMANEIFTETKKREAINDSNKLAEEKLTKEKEETNLEKAQIEETTKTEKDPTFHPSCMWLEMVFLMAEAQENGIPPHEFFKSIYGENNKSGVPQCAFYKAFAEAGNDVPATG